MGGLNPHAVEWMWRMQGRRGRVVWLPTFDAENHLRRFGVPGEGLRVARDGRVVPELEAVLQVIARAGLVLHTGHVSAEEVLLVLRRARELGVARLVVTHAMAQVPGLSLAQMQEAAALGAYLELAYLTHLLGPQAHLDWMCHWQRVSLEEMAQAIRAVGAEHFILSTDLGQLGTPIPPDGYTLLVTGLQAAGISQAELDQMMKTNPARLLGLAG
ncbi:MAG: hypothetical protein KatS3mg131_3368 [Candidatus Tectimicrobiota bacterium]|nr:MAG: hypothetical protein KatS3mg131_3368 [Candidatus Tectomicrobia bacterium]